MRRVAKRRLALLAVLVVLAALLILVRGYRSLDDSVKGTLPVSTAQDREATDDRAQRVALLLGSAATVKMDWVTFEPEIIGGSWEATVEGVGDPESVQAQVIKEFKTLSGSLGVRLLDAELFSFTVRRVGENKTQVLITGPARMKAK
jgi:hypothetical protein